MKPAELAAELARGKLRPAYLLAGAEPLLRDDALEAIEAAVLDAGPRDFNLDRLEIGRCEPGRLEEALGTLPVMAARRLVVLREGDGRGGKVDGLTPASVSVISDPSSPTSRSICGIQTRLPAGGDCGTAAW